MVKNSFLLIFIFLFSCTKKDVFDAKKQFIINPIAKCENGFAGEYPCNDYDLLTHISLEDMSGENTTGSDCWGWVNPLTDNEYALMCTNKGVTFVDITDPANAVILGTLKTRTVDNPIREIKVHNSIAYIVSEADDHQMQLFNLRRLEGVINPPEEFTADKIYNSFKTAHNITINEDSGYAYVVGSDTYNGGPHFVDLNKNFKPIEAGGYADNSYSNDIQVVTYNGPDTEYSGKEILIGSNQTEVVIVDVTDKENPKKITSFSYPNISYTHKGWFTEDQRYFIVGDEFDERDFGMNTKTIVFDFSDLNNPIHHVDYFGLSIAIDHNGYVKGNLLYQANYTGGIRMIDISDIENKNLSEVGYFDTYPENDNASFNGTQNVYPYLPSGNIIVSDISRGLFVIRKKGS
ncbi:choice-of-anchor B family protein [Polaribacter sp. MSW13]|uniref:Choice-of-anchor B family protein n=1 Tax=Polaribacter marinus TaxID=2916838 RepID=A0A9X1VRF8_9FLAO|nr:choice-of-anchor B family protein [Polaribacter marinus]MCI2229405.1 choice-of-anchor B family protein [Polaribacter marinus]